MKRWAALALAALLATACKDAELVGTSGDIRVSAEAVAFPSTYVGYPTTATVTVENTSRSPVNLRAEVDGGFGLEAPPDRIPGAGTVALVLSFAPVEPGSAAGTLVIEAAGHRFDLPVTATAVAAPSCSTAEACRDVHFDPDTGSCIALPSADDTPCQSHCVADGRCLDGECRGAEDGCDDGDPCTRDLLGGDCRCLHEPVPDRPAEDPCHRETCVAGVGWQVERAPDGTVCGPINECTGQFCRDGVCGDPNDAPAGTICRAGTPCRKPSRCERDTDGRMACLPGSGNPTLPLAPVWRVAPAGNRRILFDGIADDRYLYWAECDDDGCGLRSISPLVDREGVTGIDPNPSDYAYEAFDRWDGAAPMFAGPVAANGGLMLSRGRVFSTLRRGWLEGFDPEAGTPVFRLDLAAEGTPVGRGGQAVNAYGDVVLLLADPAGVPRAVVAVSPAGSIAWRNRRTGVVRGLVADEDGNVFFTEETDDRSRLISLDGSGRERFAVTAAPDAPLAAYGGRVLHGDGTLYATVDGAAAGPRLPLLVPELTLPPVLGPTAGWLAGYPENENGPDWTAYSLFHFDPADGSDVLAIRLSNVSASWDRSEPLLVDGDGVVLAEGSAGDACTSRQRLQELTASGAPSWVCELSPGAYGGPATVLSSLWIARDDCRGGVAAFLLEVAGQRPRSLAADGWLGGGGEPGRGARPRRP